ncbi:MAG: hypothetical protein ACLP2X_15820 [Syntrophobacteraceae bacterium]
MESEESVFARVGDRGGMLLVFFAVIFRPGEALAQTATAEKKAGKAPADASYSAKVPEKPVQKAEEKTSQAPI